MFLSPKRMKRQNRSEIGRDFFERHIYISYQFKCGRWALNLQTNFDSCNHLSVDTRPQPAETTNTHREQKSFKGTSQVYYLL